MGKQGPCHHCGVTSTPLWRNGPPEKPVLCNACGSRWRTKGSLVNYTPLHARAEPDIYEDHTASRVKSISVNTNKVLKRKLNYESLVVSGVDFDEDTSHRSSSGSPISNSESCAQFGYADASDLTGTLIYHDLAPVLSGSALSFCGTQSMPSKKRTFFNRPKHSTFEKLAKDLYNIWHEQESSCFSEEDLLLHNENPIVSGEIGHGSVLIRHSSSTQYEESEASSLTVENKHSLSSEAYSLCSLSPPVCSDQTSVSVPSPAIEKAKSIVGHKKQEQPQRDKSTDEKVQVLGCHKSQLCDIDLKDALNFGEFTRLLTSEEQQVVLKYLSPLDTDKTPHSKKCRSDNPEFKENTCIYQQLLSEGEVDLSSKGKADEYMMLKRLMLSNLSKSEWVELLNQLKEYRNDAGKSSFEVESGDIGSNNLVGTKRSRDAQIQKISDVKAFK